VDIANIARELKPVDWLREFGKQKNLKSDGIEVVLGKLQNANILSMGVICLRSPADLKVYGINLEDLGIIRYALRELGFAVREAHQDTENLPLVLNKSVPAPTTLDADFTTPAP
jgi:hypothetical protein